MRRGGGKGALIGDNLSHTLQTGNDQTVVEFACANGTSFGQRKLEDVSGTVTTKESIVRGDTKLVVGKFWNGNDYAEALTCTSNSQLMPDKGRLQCVIEPAVECIDTRQAEVQETELAPTLIATDYKGGKAVGIGRDVFNQGQNAKYGMSLSEDVQPTLTAKGPGAVCFENHPSDARLKEIRVSPTVMSRWGTGGNGVGAQEELAYTQNATGVMGVSQHSTVRRLLPVETERLQGFPDNFTQIAWNGKAPSECPDAPRYKAMGNSMAIPCMEWIGIKINEVNK